MVHTLVLQRAHIADTQQTTAVATEKLSGLLNTRVIYTEYSYTVSRSCILLIHAQHHTCTS